MKHNAAIVTNWNISELEAAHLKAREIFDATFAGSGMVRSGAALVSDIIHGIVNSQASFFIAPDGSKEGWSDSDKSDEARKEFLDWIISSKNLSTYIEVRFGGDDEYENIERSLRIDLDKIKE